MNYHTERERRERAEKRIRELEAAIETATRDGGALMEGCASYYRETGSSAAFVALSRLREALAGQSEAKPPAQVDKAIGDMDAHELTVAMTQPNHDEAQDVDEALRWLEKCAELQNWLRAESAAETVRKALQARRVPERVTDADVPLVWADRLASEAWAAGWNDCRRAIADEQGQSND